MADQPKNIERFVKQIQDIFKNNPEAKQRFPLLKEKLIHFAQSRDKAVIERFTEAWGNCNTRSMTQILNSSFGFAYVRENDMREFFNFLLRKLS